MKELMKTTVRCIVCNDTFDLMIDPKDLNRWAEGELIQDALDYLSADERELLLSGHCGACWDALFPDIDDLFSDHYLELTEE